MTDPMAEDRHQSAETGGGSVPAGEAGGLGDSAPRRTHLAAERTYLAWLRTGLGALGIGLAVGRLIPALLDSQHMAFALLGVGYSALGVFLILFSGWRHKRVRAALVANEAIPDDDWVVDVLTISGLALAIATIVLVLVEV